MITLMVNVYAEDTHGAINSAMRWLPVSSVVELHGRYEGFPDLGHEFRRVGLDVDVAAGWTGAAQQGGKAVWPSEHAKRNRMIELAGEPNAMRWLFWLDADERVIYASPQIEEQLNRAANLVGIRFIEPLPPDLSFLPGTQDPRRTFRDRVIEPFAGRLYRHVEGLSYRHRHDYLYIGEELVCSGPTDAARLAPPVDVTVMHRWWDQPEFRRAAKKRFYASEIRASETSGGHQSASERG